MTSSVPKHRALGIPYAQHKNNSCHPTSFGTIKCQPQQATTFKHMQDIITTSNKHLYLGGTGINIDTSGLCPIINIDPEDIRFIGTCDLPFELRGSTITFAGPVQNAPCVGGAFAAHATQATNTETLANIVAQSTVDIGPATPFTDLTATPAVEQFGVPLTFGRGSTDGVTGNNMTFMVVPYNAQNVQGLAFAGVTAGGVIDLIAVFTV